MLAINHLSAIDPPLVGSFSTRAIWCMTKSELIELPFIGEAFGWAGGFPIRRRQNARDGFRKPGSWFGPAMSLGILVEGTRQRFGYPGRVHAGALTIALRERVPLIPAAIESAGRPVTAGPAASFSGSRCIEPNGNGARIAGELARLEILRLWRQAGEAIAAGFPPQLPDGTTRRSWPRARELRRAHAQHRASGLL